MTDLSNETILDNLILVRLLELPKRGLTVTRLGKDLEPFFEHRCAGAEWTHLLDEALERLANAALLLSERKGKTLKLAPTAAGRARALAFLGIADLPPATTWAKLKNAYLPARALGIALATPEAAKKFGTITGLRAAILKWAHNLPIGDTPTMKQAVDALLWKQLGVETARPFSMSSVQKHLLGNVLDAERDFEPTQLKQLIPAKAVGARRSDPAELRLALFRGWVEGSKAPPARPTEAQEIDLSAFAERIRHAASACTSGRFGQGKIFISHVYRKFRELHPKIRLEESAFKKKLTEANNAGLLALARADLVQAMDPEDVAQSETRYLNATFHFIRI